MLDLLPPHKKSKFYIFLDEVGRGCLAGPVVVGGCLWKPHTKDFDLTSIPASWKFLREVGVKDSKKVAEHTRSHILKELKLNPFLCDGESFEVNQDKFFLAHTQFEVEVIERINILAATMELMGIMAKKLCLLALESKDLLPNDTVTVIVDGNTEIPHLLMDQIKFEQLAVPKSDLLFAPTGLASIYAKIYRDHIMQVWNLIYPKYEMHRHKGYGTLHHRESIKNYGPTPVHRRTFAGVKEYFPWHESREMV